MKKEMTMSTSIRLPKIRSWVILAYLLIGAMLTLLPVSMQGAGMSSTDRGGRLGDSFSILLSGPYKPVVRAPDLGLTTVDLNDGSYSKTKIFRVSGLPEEDRGHGDRDGDKDKPIGTFYVQFAGSLVAYDLRGVRYQWFLSTNQISNPFPTGKEGRTLWEASS
jgi:hypothetical protein